MTPELRRGRSSADAAAPSFVVAKVAGSEGAVETTPSGKCVRTLAGVVRCNQVEVARDVRSMEAHPYLLRADGSLFVVADGEDDEDGAARQKIVRPLPPMTRVVRAGDGTCGLSRDGEVWCWTEPTFGFSYKIEKAAAATATKVPRLTGVVDLFVQQWLTLCALTKDGAVSCSSPSGPPTEICMLRGPSTVRCGPQTEGPAMPQNLAGEGFDARRSLERALVSVPAISGATAIAPYRHAPTTMLESGRRMFVYGVDPGGCARTGEDVRCWEHDRCKPKEQWRSTAVEGLPPKVREMVLGADAGYVITESGELHRWPRRDVAQPDCGAAAPPFTIHARRVDIQGRVLRVAADVFPRVIHPGSLAVDCAMLEGGKISCWSDESDGSERVFVSVP